MVAPDRPFPHIVTDPGVYEPQEDSWMLCEALGHSGLADGARVLDLCTGTGIVAIEAALLGARRVVALDISESAVACAGRNAERAGVVITAWTGSLDTAASLAPFDLVVANPPYVPSQSPPSDDGSQRSWNAGADGRMVLDPLCAATRGLLAPGGSVLIVQSEFADPARTLGQLESHGLRASVVATRTIEFGPVLHAHAEWLERSGRLDPGRRTEELVVIRGDRR